MLIGVDWGGTKIEAMAISDSGQPVTRLREMTPRSNYEGCLATIESLVSRVEAGAGATGTVGIGIPGSVDPRTGLAKGASSTWLNGRPVEADLRVACDGKSGSPMMPIALRSLRQSMAQPLVNMLSSR
jgi:fructokinase